jgi:hypothetical protein
VLLANAADGDNVTDDPTGCVAQSTAGGVPLPYESRPLVRFTACVKVPSPQAVQRSRQRSDQTRSGMLHRFGPEIQSITRCKRLCKDLHYLLFADVTRGCATAPVHSVGAAPRSRIIFDVAFPFLNAAVPYFYHEGGSSSAACNGLPPMTVMASMPVISRTGVDADPHPNHWSRVVVRVFRVGRIRRGYSDAATQTKRSSGG